MPPPTFYYVSRYHDKWHHARGLADISESDTFKHSTIMTGMTGRTAQSQISHIPEMASI